MADQTFALLPDSHRKLVPVPAAEGPVQAQGPQGAAACGPAMTGGNSTAGAGRSCARAGPQVLPEGSLSPFAQDSPDGGSPAGSATVWPTTARAVLRAPSCPSAAVGFPRRAATAAARGAERRRGKRAAVAWVAERGEGCGAGRGRPDVGVLLGFGAVASCLPALRERLGLSHRANCARCSQGPLRSPLKPLVELCAPRPAAQPVGGVPRARRGAARWRGGPWSHRGRCPRRLPWPAVSRRAGRCAVRAAAPRSSTGNGLVSEGAAVPVSLPQHWAGGTAAP